MTGTHTAIRIDNLQFDEGSIETSRLDLMVKGLSEIGFDAQKLDIHVGLTPDQGKRIRYYAIAIAAPTRKGFHPGCSQSWTAHQRASSSSMSSRALDRSVTRSAAI